MGLRARVGGCLRGAPPSPPLPAPRHLSSPTPAQLFAEEVVRGGPAFAVSLVLSSVEPSMRSAAELGAWQLISPSDALGRLEVVPDLHGIQDKASGGSACVGGWVGRPFWLGLWVVAPWRWCPTSTHPCTHTLHTHARAHTHTHTIV